MAATASDAVLAGLRRYWGYSTFRPGQERVVRSLLAGRDVCVVMPTGGGKSLCYQLPAALQEGRLAVVISPLIALMHDQVAQLTEMGIAAASLNSASESAEQARVWRQAESGQLRLLYLSPERLARADTRGRMERVPLSQFVIDEAHCISEWGHEFRPEYRELSALREHFPEVPIAAFTASATRRVRHDILAQLRLRDPEKVIASFHRPNLRYWVHACKSAAESERMLMAALGGMEEGNAIIYAPTIARVEATAAWLNGRGVPAIGYHGKMDAATRRRHQERWMTDEVRVLVGTLAFGLGINKADVRAVIHLSLPKSIEQYYQEAGRAGRDGEAADCVLLWQRRDLGLLAHFIEQVEDEDERERSWQRYHEVRRFAEGAVCRHRQICLHFGERPKWDNCEACDVCGYKPVWQNAQPGAVEVAAKLARAARRGAATAAATVARAAASLAGPRTDGEGGLREHLREWRRVTAREARLPAYIVLHDRTLDELCARRPHTLEELLEVPGLGERKVARYGEGILDALRRFRADGSDVH